MAAVVLPRPVRKAIEDRFFYSVFHLTRVTNDAYGWRPEDGGEDERPQDWRHPWEREEEASGDG